MSDEDQGEFAAEVANHYNQVEQKTIKDRHKSDIIELRRFNNAMKSLMHHHAFKYAQSISNDGSDKRRHFRVLDLGCGKGGDLPKYARNNQVELVVGVDIADVSIKQCKDRYKSLREKQNRNLRGEFFVADLTRVKLREELKEFRTMDFHIASTQFSIHYSFESFEQAVRYISNAKDNLVKHGIIVGTYPDGPKLLKLARESSTPGTYEVADILSVKFAPEDLKNPKPFGTKYHFKLKEVVDCPEFLVHPEILRRLMRQLGFYEVYDRSFEEQLKESCVNNVADGETVRNIFQDHYALIINGGKATLDDSMWRAASIYRCFCYRKMN